MGTIKFEIQSNKLLDCNKFDGVYIDESYHKDVVVHPKKLLIKPLKGIRLLVGDKLYTIVKCCRVLPSGETVASIGSIADCKNKWIYSVECVESNADIQYLTQIRRDWLV